MKILSTFLLLNSLLYNKVCGQLPGTTVSSPPSTPYSGSVTRPPPTPCSRTQTPSPSPPSQPSPSPSPTGVSPSPSPTGVNPNPTAPGTLPTQPTTNPTTPTAPTAPTGNPVAPTIIQSILGSNSNTPKSVCIKGACLSIPSISGK